MSLRVKKDKLDDRYCTVGAKYVSERARYVITISAAKHVLTRRMENHGTCRHNILWPQKAPPPAAANSPIAKEALALS